MHRVSHGPQGRSVFNELTVLALATQLLPPRDKAALLGTQPGRRRTFEMDLSNSRNISLPLCSKDRPKPETPVEGSELPPDCITSWARFDHDYPLLEW